eukprot:3140939-Pleurochrysis_carterae.AAC.4
MTLYKPIMLIHHVREGRSAQNRAMLISSRGNHVAQAFSPPLAVRVSTRRVKVANGMALPVEFLGSIILRIPAGDVCNKNGVYSATETILELHDTLYVPGLCATLLSTKAMFQKQGIHIYLNDELLLVLPSDHHVRIRESSANYSVTLSSDKNFVCAMTNEIDTVERARGQIGQYELILLSVSRSHRRHGRRSVKKVSATGLVEVKLSMLYLELSSINNDIAAVHVVQKSPTIPE